MKKSLFTPEYKAAWDKCLRIARRMCYIDMDDPKRAILQKELDEARAEREAIRAREKGGK